MKIMLTSCLWEYREADGRELPNAFIRRNGLLNSALSIWRSDARVLLVCSSPDDYDGNDRLYSCMREALAMSGLDFSSFVGCDNRNPRAVDGLKDTDILIFAGGHVPTQNRFMKQLHLRERLRDFDGSILALSAGSMNCADVVYSIPELSGEAADPIYERWLCGLGLTDINIFPHFQHLKDVPLDGLRMEDIALADSHRHEIVALTDGSYILIADGRTTVHGEAYMIKDGERYPLSRDGQAVCLREG